MFGKQSEERKFKKLTEKDIQERLYGFHRQTDMAGTPVPTGSEADTSPEKTDSTPAPPSEPSRNYDLSAQEEGSLAEEGHLSVETETKPQTDLFEGDSESDFETVLEADEESEPAQSEETETLLDDEEENGAKGEEDGGEAEEEPSIELLKQRIQKKKTEETGLKINTTSTEETELPDVTHTLSDGGDGLSSSAQEQRTFIFNQEKTAKLWGKLEEGIEGFVKWVRQSPLTFAGIVGGIVVLAAFFSIKWMMTYPAPEKPTEPSKPEIAITVPISKPVKPVVTRSAAKEVKVESTSAASSIPPASTRSNQSSSAGVTSPASSNQGVSLPGKTYSIQLALSDNIEASNDVLAGLKKRGHEGYIRKIRGSRGNELYQIFVGRYSTSKDARVVMQELRKDPDFKVYDDSFVRVSK